MRREELAHQVTIGRVDLHTIEARTLASLGGSTVLPDDLFDLPQRKLARHRARNKFLHCRSRHRFSQPCKLRHDLPSTVIELREHQRSMRMHGLGQLHQSGNFVVIINSELSWRGFSLTSDVNISGDDE